MDNMNGAFNIATEASVREGGEIAQLSRELSDSIAMLLDTISYLEGKLDSILRQEPKKDIGIPETIAITVHGDNIAGQVRRVQLAVNHINDINSRIEL